MIFNSLEFLVFFLLFFFFYWYVTKNNLKLQNFLLLICSYVFYAWSDWRLLSYLIVSSAINFYLGIHIEKATDTKLKKLLLNIGLLQGIGGLAFFKYFNFFIISFRDAFHSFGISLNVSTLNLIVPLGISFFTFRTVSYLLDINKGKISPTNNWVVFFAYVSFFPTILSGPIDRAKTFIPQLEKQRGFDYEKFMEGFKLIVWGLFKKVVIANTLSTLVSDIFSNYTTYNSFVLIVGAMTYTFQIYTDFSGYSDMAIGISKLLGFDVTPNFNYPLLTENIAEFWRNWHMSLTSWLTEYLFTPLSIAFRDYGQLGTILAIVINFTIIGIWHGANWTFILFGFMHGCYYIPLILNGTFNKKKKKIKAGFFPTLPQLLNMVGTFTLVSLTFVLFRSNTIAEAFGYYKQIITGISYHQAQLPPHITVVFFIFLFMLSEWYIRKNTVYALLKNKIVSQLFYIILGVLIFFYIGQEESYIYFKF